MKAIIEAQAYFKRELHTEDDTHEVEIEIRGAPDDDLEQGQILLVHPKCSLELNLSELQAALRMFERRGDERR